MIPGTEKRRAAALLLAFVLVFSPSEAVAQSGESALPAPRKIAGKQFLKDSAIYYGSIWAFRFFYVRNKNERIYKTSPSEWWEHISQSPETDDGDEFFTNYIVHPFAGYVSYLYYREMGYGFWGSALGSALQSTLFEYTVEGLVETPSLPDLISTPVLGTALGFTASNISDFLIGVDNPAATFFAHLINPMRNFVNNGRVALINPLAGRFEYSQSFDISHVPWKNLAIEQYSPHSFYSALPMGYAGARLEVSGARGSKGQIVLYNLRAELPSNDYRKSLYVIFNQSGVNNLELPADGYELSNFRLGGKYALVKTPAYWLAAGFESHLPTIYKDNVRRLEGIKNRYRRDLPVYLRDSYALTPFAGAGAKIGPFSFETNAAFALVKKAEDFEGDESEKILKYGAALSLSLPVNIAAQLSAEFSGNRFFSLGSGKKNNSYFTAAIRFGRFLSPSLALQIPVSGHDDDTVSQTVITEIQIRF